VSNSRGVPLFTELPRALILGNSVPTIEASRKPSNAVAYSACLRS
jgi:hypothetical protein